MVCVLFTNETNNRRKEKTMKSKNTMYVGMIGAIGFLACAGKQPPIEAMTRADMTVKRVDQTKAVQAAPLDMRIAHEKLEQAKRDMEHKNYEAAQRNAEDASALAELAESKSNLQDTKAKTTDAQQGLETLQSEVQHSNERGTK